MSMISEQVRELRELAKVGSYENGMAYPSIKKALIQAADTIESLSAKLQAANEELERWHTDRINENIENPFAQTSTLICHDCDHKDEYIEELEAANMEWSERYYNDGWIPCEDRLPDIECDVLLSLRSLDIYTGFRANEEGVFYVEGEGYVEYENVLGWQPLPEPLPEFLE